MALVCNKDQSALAALIHRHIDTLHNYAFRLSGSSAFAQDLVQDTWLATWEKAHTYSARKVKLTTWLHRVLYNKFVDTMRKGKYEVVMDSPQEPATEPDSLDGDLHASRLGKQVLFGLQQLPDNQRSALMLTHLQGFTNKEVATIMGLSVRATESLLARARSSLKDKLNQ